MFSGKARSHSWVLFTRRFIVSCFCCISGQEEFQHSGKLKNDQELSRVKRDRLLDRFWWQLGNVYGIGSLKGDWPDLVNRPEERCAVSGQILDLAQALRLSVLECMGVKAECTNLRNFLVRRFALDT